MKRYIKAADEMYSFLKTLAQYIKREAMQYGVAEVKSAGSILTVTLYVSSDKVGTDNFISRMSEDFSDEAIDSMRDSYYLENTAYAIVDDLANDNSGSIIKGPDW